MYRITSATGLMVVLTLLAAPAARAQNSTAAPLSSTKENGVAGDPNGAVRALGSTEDDPTAQKPVVTIPATGGGGASRTGGAPLGTASGAAGK